MKPILLPLVAVFLLTACSLPAKDSASGPAAETHPGEPSGGGAAVTEAAAPAAPPLPAVELTPSLLYRFLLAEIAGQRGLIADAATLHLDVAKETRDPRLARRATEIALHGRRMDVALAAGRLWLETEPGSAAARQALVSLLAAEGQFGELETLLTRLLADEPAHLAQNLSHLNRLFGRAGDRAAARRLIDAVTGPYLHLAEAHYARAVAAREARDLPAALASFRRALEIRPGWEAAALARAQATEDHAVALAGLAEFVRANPQARDARLAYARLLTSEKNYAAARRQFRVLVEQIEPTAPRHGDMVFAVALLSLELNDTAEAEEMLRAMVARGHAEADRARLHLGQIAAAGKRWEEARDWHMQVGPGEHFVTARLQQVHALLKQGRPDAARALLAATRAAQPQERVRLWLAEAQLLREQGDNAAAYGVLAEALRLEPDQPEMLYEIALLAEKLDRIDELETRLRRLIELRPEHAHAYNALGYSLADRNIRLDEARKLIERALELAPNDPFILDSQGWVLFRLGDRQGALDYLQRAYAQRTDPEIAAHLGEVLWVLGRQDDARAIWDKARREHPTNEVLAETIKRFLP